MGCPGTFPPTSEILPPARPKSPTRTGRKRSQTTPGPAQRFEKTLEGRTRQALARNLHQGSGPPDLRARLDPRAPVPRASPRFLSLPPAPRGLSTPSTLCVRARPAAGLSTRHTKEPPPFTGRRPSGGRAELRADAYRGQGPPLHPAARPELRKPRARASCFGQKWGAVTSGTPYTAPPGPDLHARSRAAGERASAPERSPPPTAGHLHSRTDLSPNPAGGGHGSVLEGPGKIA